MTETTVGPESVRTLHALSDLLHARADEALVEMRSNTDYWGPAATDEAFTKGIAGAVGHGHLAASFTPSIAHTLADLLDLLADTEGEDMSPAQYRIYNTACDLAARYPGVDLAGDWPLALRPRPDEPQEFGAVITAWIGTPERLGKWLSIGDRWWLNKDGLKRRYTDLVVTEISESPL